MTWAKFALIMVACAAGGLGIARLVVAVVSQRAWRRVVG